MIVSFYVPMEGVPKGSKRAVYVKNLGRSLLLDNNSEPLRSYESTISSYAQDHFPSPVEGPVVVDVSFVRAKKKSAPKSYRPYVTTSPDVDKMLRSVLDGLQGFAYLNDSQVVRATGEKLTPFGEHFTHPGTYLTITAGRDVPAHLGEFSPRAVIDF